MSDGGPHQVARNIVLAKLTAAPRTRSQLAQALVERNVPDDVAAHVLDRFEEVGLVDDAEFASRWVRSRHLARGLGRRALRQELAVRGIDGDQIEAALAEIDDDAERAGATDLIQRRWAGVSRLDVATRQRRLFGLLMRRGYSAALAERVIAEVSATNSAI